MALRPSFLPVGVIEVLLQLGGGDLRISASGCRTRVPSKLLGSEKAGVTRHDGEPAVPEPVWREAFRQLRAPGQAADERLDRRWR